MTETTSIPDIERVWRHADATPALYGTEQVPSNEWGIAYHQHVRVLLDRLARLENERSKLETLCNPRDIAAMRGNHLDRD